MAKSSKSVAKSSKQNRKRGVAVTPPNRIGQGYSLFTGDGLNTAIVGDTDESSSAIVLKCRICDSTESFLGVLDVSASATAGFSKIASVDAKLELMYSLNLTAHTVSIVVHCKHVTGTTQFYDARLKSAPPATPAQLRDFFAAYGDTYVSEITKGGEYLAVYAFYSETRDEQIAVMADLKAAGIIDGVPVSGELQSKISLAMKTSSTRINLEQRVLGVDVELPEPNKIVDFALKFGKLKKDKPVTLAIAARGYEHVVGMSSYFEPVRVNRIIMIQLVEKSGRVQRLINQIGAVEEIYDYYGGFVDTNLRNVRAQAERDIATIDAEIDRYLRDPLQDFSAAARLSLPSLANGLPTVACDLVDERLGGDGGQGPKNDINPATAVAQRLSISRIELFADDDVVRKIKMTYASEDIGKATVEVGGGGGKGNAYDFGDKEYIANVAGLYKKVITSLRVQTNSGYIHVAKKGQGAPFGYSPPSGYFAVALHAKGDGKGVHSLTLYSAKLKAARWVPG